MRIAFLASGNLGFQVLSGLIHLKPEFIATDSLSDRIIALAKANAIPVFKGNPRNGRLCQFMGEEKIDLMLSINYLFIIEKDVLSRAETVVNFHGSLLPKYRGRTPHVWAIINNERSTGVTAHLVNEGCDTGDILLQREFPIREDMTGGDILKSFEEVYPVLVKEVVDLYGKRKMQPVAQDTLKATYFGKRTPEDGLINWSWQKERIRNWVRAQAFPYPGAFSTVDGERVIIDKISYSDFGFDYVDPNGLVLSTGNDLIIVKTPNGAVELEQIRNKEIVKKIIPGKILQ